MRKRMDHIFVSATEVILKLSTGYKNDTKNSSIQTEPNI